MVFAIISAISIAVSVAVTIADAAGNAKAAKNASDLASSLSKLKAKVSEANAVSQQDIADLTNMMSGLNSIMAQVDPRVQGPLRNRMEGASKKVVNLQQNITNNDKKLQEAETKAAYTQNPGGIAGLFSDNTSDVQSQIEQTAAEIGKEKK